MISKDSTIITAEWRHLVMLNYEVDPSILTPYIPPGCQLDEWQGKTLVSLVGFLFLNTRLFGLPIPFHKNFEEVNLRFYVKRNDCHAVSFIKEIVPRKAVAFIARTFYKENYFSAPMRHTIEHYQSSTTVHYEWQWLDRWQRFGVRSHGEATLAPQNSQVAFITQHTFGYATGPRGKTLEYQVKHPAWRVAIADDCTVDIDIKNVYGEKFVPYLSKPPLSAFLVEGSEVSITKPTALFT